MTEELVIRKIRNSDSRMTSFDIINSLKLQSTMKALLKDELH